MESGGRLAARGAASPELGVKPPGKSTGLNRARKKRRCANSQRMKFSNQNNNFNYVNAVQIHIAHMVKMTVLVSHAAGKGRITLTAHFQRGGDWGFRSINVTLRPPGRPFLLYGGRCPHPKISGLTLHQYVKIGLVCVCVCACNWVWGF